MGKTATTGKPGPGAGKPTPGKPVPAKAAPGKPGEGSSTGMDRKALKMELRYAADGPINIAFAQGDGGKALVQLHRRKFGRALEFELRDQAPDARNHRWGTLELDPSEPKQAIVKVNKSISGMARRLVLAMKGTGIKKIKLVPLDGGEPETHEEEDETEQEEEEVAATPRFPARRTEEPSGGEAPGGTKAQGPEVRPSAEPTPGGKLQAGDEDAAARPPEEDDSEAEEVKALLMDLVKRMLQAIQRDPSQQATLSKLATAAQASLKRGDLEQAAAGAEILRMALDGLERTPASGNGGAPPNGGKREAGPDEGPAAPDDAALEVLARSGRTWTAARARVDGDLRKLQAAVVAANEGEFGDALADEFVAAVKPVLGTLDDTLAKIFTAAAGTKDPAQGAALKKHARATLVRYAKFVQSDPTIKHLDANPFVDLQIGKTLSAVLGRLSSQVK